MGEVIENAFLLGIAKVGDGVSWVTQSIIKWLAQYGVSITAVQSKVLTILVLAFGIYVVLGLLTITKKILKWGILIGIIFLLVSVGLSIFI